MSQIEIYRTKDGETQIEVKFEEETVWLTQAQIVDLFQTTKSNISEHIKHIFEEGELDSNRTVRKFRTVRTEGKKRVSRELDHYNLDLILSIGYRINSKRGTQFRIWATQRLKDFLVKGYALNEKRLGQVLQNMQELERAVKLIQQSGNSEQLSATEAKGLLEIITNYTQSFILLNQFDSNNLPDKKLNENITYEIEHEEAIKAIAELKKQLVKKKEASALFGNERDHGFESTLNSVVQTFNGEYLYKA